MYTKRCLRAFSLFALRRSARLANKWRVSFSRASAPSMNTLLLIQCMRLMCHRITELLGRAMRAVHAVSSARAGHTGPMVGMTLSCGTLFEVGSDAVVVKFTSFRRGHASGDAITPHAQPKGKHQNRSKKRSKTGYHRALPVWRYSG